VLEDELVFFVEDLQSQGPELLIRLCDCEQLLDGTQSRAALKARRESRYHWFADDEVVLERWGGREFGVEADVEVPIEAKTITKDFDIQFRRECQQRTRIARSGIRICERIN